MMSVKYRDLLRPVYAPWTLGEDPRDASDSSTCALDSPAQLLGMG